MPDRVVLVVFFEFKEEKKKKGKSHRLSVRLRPRGDRQAAPRSGVRSCRRPPPSGCNFWFYPEKKKVTKKGQKVTITAKPAAQRRHVVNGVWVRNEEAHEPPGAAEPRRAGAFGGKNMEKKHTKKKVFRKPNGCMWLEKKKNKKNEV